MCLCKAATQLLFVAFSRAHGVALAPIADALSAAAAAVDTLRCQSGYHLLSLTDLFGVPAAGRSKAAGTGAATAAVASQ
jgi:hypothetical protein